ncbi:MAG: glycosyltransferase [Verrucomicrobiota bacterium]
MSAPSLSVVIPVKDGERFLGDAIRSVFAQQYSPIDIIVVDGRSSDRTVAVAESFPGVRCFTQSGSGLPRAYNEGIAAARGEWIAFLEHDDVWTPDKLAVQIPFMVARPQLLYTLTRVRFFLEPGHTPPPGFRREWLAGDHAGSVLSTFVGRREVFETVGPFNPQLSIAGDVDWFARANDLQVPMEFVPRALLEKRVHGGNLTGNVAVNNRELLHVIGAKLRRGRAGPA